MTTHAPELGRFYIRMPLLRLEPTWQQELRDVGKNLIFPIAWGLVRLGFWVSRHVEPCEVCPRCGTYPCIGHDGRCAECGSEVFNTQETEDFR